MSRQYHFMGQSEDLVKHYLAGLLESRNDPARYRKYMMELGKLLASSFISQLSQDDKILIISTAEDTDYLQKGVSDFFQQSKLLTRLAVLWNNHYSLSNNMSVAPIVHRFIQPDYENATKIVIVKSVISGSCVVRTNLIDMLHQVETVEKVYIVSPVIHKDAKKNLKDEFPAHISDKFEFIYFAEDSDKKDGEVIPGIGGQIYALLGLDTQPVLTGYIPEMVKKLAFG